jgi:co-chaperonin GroES (HSP10)
MPQVAMFHETDPKTKIREEIGDLDGIQLFGNQILVAVYIRPEKTKSGIYLTNQTLEEDRYQGKVGLVLGRGALAFVDPEEKYFGGMEAKEDDWIVFRPSDGFQITINKVLCRVLRDDQVRLVIPTCDTVY